MTLRTLSLAVARVADSSRRKATAVAATASLVAVGTAQANNGVEADHSGVAGMIAPDAAVFFGIENAGAGLRKLSSVNAEAEKAVKELLEGEEQAQLWTQALTGDWGMAFSDEILPWTEALNQANTESTVQSLTNLMKAQFDLVGGRIQPEELPLAMLGAGAEGDFASPQEELMANFVGNLPGKRLPGIAVVVRPATTEARDFLAKSAEDFAVQAGAGMPPSITSAEQRVGPFGCRTWSAPVAKLLEDSGASPAEAAQGMAESFDLSPDQIAGLATWLTDLTLVVGYGWSDDGSTMTLFVGQAVEDLPLAAADQSLLSAEPGLTQLAGTATEFPSRLDVFYSQAAAEKESNHLWDGLIGHGAAEVLRVCAENPTDARAKTIAQATASLQQLLVGTRPQVTGNTVATMHFGSPGIKFDSLEGARYAGMDLSQPIRYAAAFDQDAPLVFAGAINPAVIDGGLQGLVDLASAGLAFQSLTEDVSRRTSGVVEADQAASNSPLGQDPHQWLRSADGQQVMNTLAQLGDRLGQSLGTQAVLTMDFAGEAPPALKQQIEDANLPGMPRVSWMADLVNPAPLDGAWGDVTGSVNQALAAVNAAQQSAADAGAVAAPTALPAPVDVEAAGVKSWFYAFGDATNKDFMPVLSRTGGQLILGSSLNQQRDLAALAEQVNAAAPAAAPGAPADANGVAVVPAPVPAPATPAEAAIATEAKTGTLIRVRLGEVLRQTLSENEAESLLGDVAEGLAASPLASSGPADLVGAEPLNAAAPFVETVRETVGDIEIWTRQEGDRIRQTSTLNLKN